MKAVLTTVFALLASATMTSAACPPGSQVLVSCHLKDGHKQLTTCLVGTSATYTFGTPEKEPELALTRHVRDVHMTPWAGVGRAIWESFSFENNGVIYEVYYSIDRASGSVFDGGVIVWQDGKELAHLECDAGTVITSGAFLPLFEAKEAAGQVFLRETQSWSD